MKVSLDTPVFELVNEHPEIVDVMVAIGLDGVTNPGLLNTVGRFVTLRKGARLKHIELERLIADLERAGFEVSDDE